ncbi:DUF3677 domain-containing protein [Aphelenchoides bicaudatus]|nr:DUF3677 domain-containing protein [Aphelenchoides bicaudatus]
MLPGRKNLMKKSLNTASGAGIKRPTQQIPSAAKKQRLEFPKQGVGSTATTSASTSNASPSTFNQIVQLDTTWQDNLKEMNLTAKDFQAMLKANRDQGKVPKAFCIAIKQLLKDEGANLDVELFKEVLKTLPKEDAATKSLAVFGAVFALLNKLETHATALNLSVLPVALKMLQSIESWPATQKLDFWLTNTKYQRYAQELILFVASNVRDLSSKVDLEILSLLSKLRLQKSRPVQNVFQRAIKEIVTVCPESFMLLTSFILETDLNATLKSQNNIGFLQFLFTQNQSEVLQLVAKRLVKRLENQDQLKQVRLFLREFFRSLQGPYFSQFSSALLEALKSYNGSHVVTVFYSCLDLFAMLPFLAISSSVRDAAQIRRNSGNLSTAQINILDRFQQQFQSFTLQAISAIKWAMQNAQMDPTIFVDSLNIVLYLRPYQSYSSDSWPTEADFNNATRLLFECAIDEKLIVTLVEMKSESVSSAEILQLIKSLTMRAIQNGVEFDSNRGGINVRNVETITKLFELSINSQKSAFVSAKLADYELFWSCWEQVFCLACMNSDLLKSIYHLYPQLRMLCAMAISGEFVFPPQHFEEFNADQLFKANAEARNEELNVIRQALIQDKKDGGDSSHLDPNKLPLCLMNPTGPVRQPPKQFLKQLRQLNDQYPFNVNLCQVNEPDILSRVCADLGPQHILPTVVTYLTSKPNQIEAVPLICICQLYLVIVCQQNSLSIDTLVHSSSTRFFISIELQELVLKIVRSYFKEDKQTVDKCQTVVEFFVAKLKASLTEERDAASCTIEKRSNLITKYLQFIVENIDENSMHRIAPRLSAIVARLNSLNEEHKTIRRNLIKFFADFMRKLIESGGTKSSQLTSPPSVHHEKLLVRLTYPKTIQVEIDADIVKAIMELLCESFGDYESKSAENKAREYLMNVWFPATKLSVSLAHEPATNVDILPESLRMRMLAAKDEKIIKFALSDVSPEGALPAVPFVRAYIKCAGADQFLKAAQQNSNDELKMEVDQNGPALFIPVKAPSFFEQSVEMDFEDEEEMSKTEEVPKFEDANSITDYLSKIANDPGSKNSAFTMSPDWIQFSQSIRSSFELGSAAITFANTNLNSLHEKCPALLYALLSFVKGQNNPDYELLASTLLEKAKQTMPENNFLLNLLKPDSRTRVRPVRASAAMDVDMRPADSGKENDKARKDDDKSNADLRMHWKLAEYFEAVLIQAANPKTKPLVRQLRQEVTEHIKNEPTVFSRQLPLLFNYVQTLLKLNTRQANEVDSYAALLHAIHVVSITGHGIFKHTQAFETFIEIFLNSMAAHSTRSKTWQSILDRLTNLMRDYLNWNPAQAMKLVERNKSAFFNVQRLYGADLKSFREFINEFPGHNC